MLGTIRGTLYISNDNSLIINLKHVSCIKQLDIDTVSFVGKAGIILGKVFCDTSTKTKNEIREIYHYMADIQDNELLVKAAI